MTSIIVVTYEVTAILVVFPSNVNPKERFCETLWPRIMTRREQRFKEKDFIVQSIQVGSSKDVTDSAV